MNVPCPCGRRCRTAGSSGPPSCYLSSSDDSLPSWVDSGAGFLGAMAFRAAVGFGQGFVKGASGIDTEYDTYQCPGCGCEVLFMITSSKRRTSRKTMADNASC